MKISLSEHERSYGMRLVERGTNVSRRSFLRALSGSAAGVAFGASIGSCGGSTEPPPTQNKAKGRILGVVVNESGTLQPSLGRIFLMYPDGRMTGRAVDTDPSGKFTFEDVDPGDWQLRFHAPRIAHVYEAEGGENPEKVTVVAGETALAKFPVVVATLALTEIEIYIGDFFFYEVPFGTENGEAVVKIGTNVCWYNVGNRVHTVTGGPWIDSGDLQKTQAFDWVSDRIGVFPYTCKHHQPEMRAVLRVVA
jgi:hypothetical protein